MARPAFALLRDEFGVHPALAVAVAFHACLVFNILWKGKLFGGACALMPAWLQEKTGKPHWGPTAIMLNFISSALLACLSTFRSNPASSYPRHASTGPRCECRPYMRCWRGQESDLHLFCKSFAFWLAIASVVVVTDLYLAHLLSLAYRIVCRGI